MVWKEVNKVEERMKFIYRFNSGESMTDLCKEFGISRVTGYKFLKRYKEHRIKLN